MMITLDALTLQDVQAVRDWLNNALETLRTPYMLTAKMQEDFYNGLSREARMRYWALRYKARTVGMGGLIGIEWENRLAEISLIIDPYHQKMGFGTKAVELVLVQGFKNMNLRTVYGECYLCNPALAFWQKVCNKYQAYTTILPDRKYWNGEYYDSLYFSIGGDNFELDGD